MSIHVELAWEGAAGADEYQIYRDTVVIATVSATSYDDDGADEGGAPDAPSVTATNGTYTDRVALQWDEPSVPPGPTHTYEVTAVIGGEESEPSNPAEGHRRGHPVSSYELRVDGGDWMDIGNTDNFDDDDADEPTFDPGIVTASEGEFIDYVALEYIEADGDLDNEHTYEVRAVNDTGPGEPGSDEGHLGIGEITIQWQRSLSDLLGTYANLSGATDTTYEDTDAPANGSPRYYRAEVSAERVETQTTEGVRGFRATDTFVYTASQDLSIRKIDSAANEVWSFDDHTVDVYGVAVDPDGYIRTSALDETLYKLDSDGTPIWSFNDHSTTVAAVAVDADGYVYTASNDDTVRKIDSDGEEVWSFTGHSNNVRGVTVDPDGNVYTASDDQTVRRLDSEGNEI